MKIRGNTVGTPMPRPDWNQTDPTKADYIRNKPDLSDIGGGGGESGATFTPTITDGVLSWTNDKGLANPEPVNVIGPQGEQGPKGDDGQQGIQGEPGADGRTPIKGVDYFTAEEVEVIAEYAAGKVPPVTPITYTLSKENGDIVLAGSDGTTCTVTDEVGSADTSVAKMLVDVEVNALTTNTTNTLWRFAFVEIASSTDTNAYVTAIVTPYHLMGKYKIVDTDNAVGGQSAVYLSVSRSGSTTTWAITDNGQSGYRITRIRAYRIA